MDVILACCDTLFFDRFWALGQPSTLNAGHSAAEHQLPAQFPKLRESGGLWWARDHPIRQTISLYLITWIFGVITYFLCSSLSYLFVFDHATFTHPKYLKHQVRLEIKQTMLSMPVMAIFTTPLFLLEVRGHGRLYDSWSEAPFEFYNILQFPLFIAFTDMCVYWIHRGLHHPFLYRRLHKPHHKWIMPTPFASHAFHPLDGFSQSLPYHLFPILFPLHKYAYVALFVFVNFWTILIRKQCLPILGYKKICFMLDAYASEDDGEYIANSYIVNGAACHTMHHLYFNYNYGQFTTIWDRLAGSYRQPNAELFTRESKMSKTEWEKQTKEMEQVQKTVEGDDDRDYQDHTSTIDKKLL